VIATFSFRLGKYQLPSFAQDGAEYVAPLARATCLWIYMSCRLFREALGKSPEFRIPVSEVERPMLDLRKFRLAGFMIQTRAEECQPPRKLEIYIII